MNNLNKVIRNERKQQGLTQAQLADKCGLKKRTISAIERGEMIGTLPTLNTILSALGLKMYVGRAGEHEGGKT